VEVHALAQKVCPACNSRYEAEVAFCSRDGTPLVHDPNAGKSDLVGQVIADRYRVMRLIGEGGMGQVYEAQHVNINRRFALKLLRPEIVSNPEAVARFRQEAWSASSIGHDNIIEIDDFATLPNGSVYLAMEYLHGRALSERMRAEPRMQLDESLAILLQVCSGLSAAHEKGIVHRDMKPENVYLAEKHGRVVAKILDFGIAKVSGAEGSQSLTRTGTIFGTPHYMSPEQALGRPLDHRSDIYSVGVIMYEAFTGRVPFEAESFMGILTKHITAQPSPPRELAPERDIPPEIEAVILKAMEKEASARQQSMGELLAELTAIAEHYAPHVLTLASGSMSAQLSAVSLRGATPVRAFGAAHPTPGALPVAHTGRITGSRTAPPVGVLAQVDDEGVARKSRGGLYAVLALAVAALGVCGYQLLKKPPVVATPVVAPTPVEKPTVAPAPAAPDVVILVDSEPVGAQILRDGKSIGDTPEDVRLVNGKPETVVLVKPGYQPDTLLLTTKDSPRRIVRLVRSAPKEPKEPKETKQPLKPVVAPVVAKQPEPVRPYVPLSGRQPGPPRVTTPPPVRPVGPTTPVRPPPLVGSPTQPKPPTRRDPYDRVDEHPKPPGEIINPY
jgi:serine/threonine-protein kinase